MYINNYNQFILENFNIKYDIEFIDKEDVEKYGLFKVKALLENKLIGHLDFYVGNINEIKKTGLCTNSSLGFCKGRYGLLKKYLECEDWKNKYFCDSLTLYVEKDYRKNNIASVLFNKMFEFLKEKKVEDIFMVAAPFVGDEEDRHITSELLRDYYIRKYDFQMIKKNSYGYVMYKKL